VRNWGGYWHWRVECYRRSRITVAVQQCVMPILASETVVSACAIPKSPWRARHLFTLVWRWRFPKPALCESNARQAASNQRVGEWASARDTTSTPRNRKESAITDSTRRQAKTSSISSHWNQLGTTPIPTELPTAVISKTKSKPTDIPWIPCFLTDLRAVTSYKFGGTNT